MGWFQEEKGEAERSCLQEGRQRRAEGDMPSALRGPSAGENGQARGVVMKLPGKFQWLLGYDCCQQILSQITAYLEETAGCPVQRSVGVGLLFLRRWTIGQASRWAEEIPGFQGHGGRGTACVRRGTACAPIRGTESRRRRC